MSLLSLVWTAVVHKELGDSRDSVLRLHSLALMVLEPVKRSVARCLRSTGDPKSCHGSCSLQTTEFEGNLPEVSEDECERCLGPWQQHLSSGVTRQDRPSLVDLNQVLLHIFNTFSSFL